jgi:hypothetical protein
VEAVARFGTSPEPAEIAVVMPTVLRPTILEAVGSIARQDIAGRVQILIGIDKALGPREPLLGLLRQLPERMSAVVLDPGYSTSIRHGGLHPERTGGVLRTVLTYLANARYVAYLDDDNWWAPNHLSSLRAAIEGRGWAWSRRWFVHPGSRRPVCIDDWESVGPHAGIFRGGFVDPSSLMIDKLVCESAIRCWGIPMPLDPAATTGDRQVYYHLLRGFAEAGTGIASSYYVLTESDAFHASRLAQMGPRYDAAGRG